MFPHKTWEWNLMLNFHVSRDFSLFAVKKPQKIELAERGYARQGFKKSAKNFFDLFN